MQGKNFKIGGARCILAYSVERIGAGCKSKTSFSFLDGDYCAAKGKLAKIEKDRFPFSWE